MKFWFHRFRSGIFKVKDAPHTDRPIFENIDKITEIIEVDQHASSRSIAQKLKMHLKTVLSHLHKVGFKKKLHELLLHDQALNSDVYCQQLDSLKLGIDQKWSKLANRRGIVFPEDNSRVLTSAVTRQNLWELRWEVLMYPPYSPPYRLGTNRLSPFSHISKLPE
ncbi:putative DD34D transposase [Trichonephila clavipes]|nr:putative DD34D transposase [Trichonephila clavipes]